jgi:hypothetical protein
MEARRLEGLELGGGGENNCIIWLRNVWLRMKYDE